MKIKILGFKKDELAYILTIFLFLIGVTALNLRTSFRKSRDSQRKTDIRNIYDALMKYEDDFGFFPLSSPDGKIMACKGPVDERGIPTFIACNWYEDSIRDIFDDSYPPYLQRIPGDPQQGKGAYYYYLSDGKHFQVYASLEGRNEAEYDLKIVARNLPCGVRICNFGRSDGGTPLDKSLEEYENELLEKENEK